MRSADGSFRERGLSQLSGGQWRRVSMALDFAFAEIIRRKGETGKKRRERKEKERKRASVLNIQM